MILNDAADKDRELGEAHAEIKALRLSERAREKAVEEVIHLRMFSRLVHNRRFRSSFRLIW